MQLLALLSAVTACGSQPAMGEPQPALLTESGPEVREELRRVVSAAMYGVEVTLAEDALTRESLLVVERQRQQPRLSGREMVPPTKFQLVVGGGACWLMRLADGERWELRKASCRPEVADQ
ncbi:hypothetical protein [Microbulbifer magnicolonia]|uniref:hypothetical protein n=1 Tax=Microbulbifer magnicolonia TaxID=3109744 RepID=UPI002B412932|nr:hypothetical protein [Microbulbifer sp. GG15]